MKTGIVTFIALAIAASTVASGQTVYVTGGQIKGAMLEKGGATFKGIPYAAPPVGELRWREPMPVNSWTSVRDATAFGAICPQTSAVILNAAETFKEDCLFLNVWTPEWPSRSRKPVMVWFAGGANIYGASSQPEFDGDSLARRGVVLVSVNYRLGSFGFFSHPGLTGESPNHASGNQGILDQIAALKWVHDNIATFGGDADNITIFGESAGAVDVGFLMTSPLSKGLFQRVIGESGAVNQGSQLTLPQAEQRGEMLVASWNVPASSSIQDLRTIPASDILKARSLPGPQISIAIDGYVFSKKPAEVFAAGEEHRVALVLGSNARDRIDPPPADLRKATEDLYGPLAGRALALYVGDADPVYGTLSERWKTDTTLRCSTVAQLAWHAAAGNPAYEFEFTRVPPGREGLGAHHGLEVPYVFGTVDTLRVGNSFVGPAQPNAVDRQVSDAIQQYWTNFAKAGDPNGGRLSVWPKFDPLSRAYIQFNDAGPVAKEGLRRPFCDLFIENVKRQMPQ